SKRATQSGRQSPRTSSCSRPTARSASGSPRATTRCTWPPPVSRWSSEDAMLFALLLAAQPQVLAVLEFRDKVPPEQRIDAAYLSDQVRSAVKELLPAVKVITRENMLVLLQASGKDLASCEGECEVDTGRRIGADLVVSGELLRFGSQYKLNMKLHDTRDGRLISTAIASGASVDALDDAATKAADDLVAPI